MKINRVWAPGAHHKRKIKEWGNLLYGHGCPFCRSCFECPFRDCIYNGESSRYCAKRHKSKIASCIMDKSGVK